MAISERSNMPGDLKSLEVLINGKNITTFIKMVYIFINILDTTWTCELDIDDTNNLIDNCQIKQGSTVEINVETDIKSDTDGKKTYKFIVNRIKDRKLVNTKQYTYKIECVMKEYILNQGKKVSHCYKNESPTNIIKKIIDEYLESKVEEVDDCDNTITHIFANSSPFDCVFMMTKVGVINKIADLIFYQKDLDKDKAIFVCKSIEKLYSDNNSDLKFTLQPSHYREKGNLINDQGLIIKNHEWQHYDAMSNISGGMTANKVVSFDFVSLEWKTETFKYGDDNDKDAEKKQWEDDKLFEQEEMNVSFHPLNNLMSKNETQYDYLKDWVGSRKSSLMKLENDKLIIQVPYTAKVTDFLSKNCEAEIPAKHDEGEEHDDYSGKFLIIGMCIMLSATGAFVNLELLKKRIGEQTEGKVKSSN